ncbi:hypothetical protein SEA_CHARGERPOWER_69 [Mycobacterium phage Chargerpower]|nr:hypothetical protein SEA_CHARGERPOWER_69 [Mycobacterium phage Chargerpower]
MSNRNEMLTISTPQGVAIFEEGVGYVRPGVDYTWVEMGPVPEMPLWHHLTQPSRYPFPTERAAFQFANTEKGKRPDRKVRVLTTDGERIEL